MTEPIVYVILVNYANAEDTLKCLQSLHKLVGTSLRVVLVENGSPDDSLAVFQAALSELTAVSEQASWLWMDDPAGGRGYPLRLMESSENLGFAGGCNIGISIAMADPMAEFIWLLNNDTLVFELSLQALVERMQRDPAIGMCGSTLVYFQPENIIQGFGGRFSPLLGRGGPIGVGRAIDDIPPFAEVEARMDYVIGASMLVSRQFVERVGPMDERYFLYFEELDWAYRARRAGFRLAWAPDSVVIHKEGAAIGSSATRRPSDIALRYMTSSYLRFIRRHLPWLLPIAIARMALNMLKWHLRHDVDAAQAVRAGIGMGLHR